jgi:hypothetical protein
MSLRISENRRGRCVKTAGNQAFQASPGPETKATTPNMGYDEVLALHGEGISQRVIANRLGIHRSTVRRFVEAGSFPERAERPSARRTDGFADYLKERWAAGCQNAMQLYGELQARGYSGSYYSVRRQLAPWRSALPPSGEGPVPKPVPAVMGRPSARRVSWLLLLDEADLEPQVQQFRERLQERCPELGSAAKLASVPDVGTGTSGIRLGCLVVPGLWAGERERVARLCRGFANGRGGGARRSTNGME